MKIQKNTIWKSLSTEAIRKLIFLAPLFLLQFVLCQANLFAQYEVKNDRILAPEVSHFTGIREPGVDSRGDLSLSIPLMTVPGRDGLDFDITAHYRSGIQVKQSASWIGLGWSLDLGSMTRNPVGGVINRGGLGIQEHADFAHALPGYGNKVESQPDIYSVNMNGSSTLVYSMTLENNPNLPYDPAKSETNGPCSGGDIYSRYEFVPSPWKPWKFCYDLGTPSVKVDQDSTRKHGSGERVDFERFIITIENGTRYVHARPTLTTTHHAETITSSGDYNSVSTWRLRAILLPNYNGPVIPDATSTGGWIKIAYKTWDRTSGNAEEVETVKDPNNYIISQITYPYYLETPTHFAFFTTSKRYDRDLGYNISGQWSNGQDNNYYHRKLDKITLYKKDEGVGLPISEPAWGGTINPDNLGTKTLQVSFTYMKNGADSLRTFSAGDPLFKKMLSKLALEEISIFGLAGTANDTLPAYKFSYYDDFGKSWLDLLNEPNNKNLTIFQDDFGFLEESGVSKGKMWSLKEITYPEGGRHLVLYENDLLNSTSIVFGEYDAANEAYVLVSDSTFVRTGQGGPRVKTVKIYDGFNDTSPDSLRYTYDAGHASAIPETWFRKLNKYINSPMTTAGERGQTGIFYEWVQKKFMDNSAIKTFYLTSSNIDTQMVYIGGPTFSDFSILQGNENWNWGEIDSVYYLDANGIKVEEEIYNWTFRGDYQDTTPILLAVVVPELLYNTNNDATDAININFTHKQLDSKVIKFKDGANETTITQSFTYHDGTLRATTTETTSDGITRTTENRYAHDVSTGAPYSNMKTNNMRSQLAQTLVYDNQNKGFASIITTWKSWTVGVNNIYLQDKIYNWKKDQTGVYTIPLFDGTTPSSTEWLETTEFVDYDDHGNVEKIEDAYNNATDIVWITAEASALIDKITANPTATQSLTTDYGYDINTFRLTSVQDPNLQTTTYEYDALQRLERIKDADQNSISEITYTYSRIGANPFDPANPNEIEEKRYRAATDFTTVTSYFDGLGRKIQTQLKKGSNDIVQHFTFDDLGRSEYLYKAFEQNTSHNFLQTSNFPTSPAPLKEKTLYDPDPLNRANRIVPFGVNETTGTDKDITFAYKIDNAINGIYYRFTETTDERENVTKEYVDGFGNRVASIGADNDPAIKTTTKFTYDLLGNLTRIDAPMGDAITYKFDTRSLMLEKTSPDDGTVKYRYDKNSSLRFRQNEKQRANNEFTYFKYDGINRLIEQGVHSNTNGEFDNTAYYEDDPTWPTTNYDWKIKNTYDTSSITGNYPLGRLTKTEVDTDGDNTTDITTRYKYDKHGRIIEKRVQIGSLAEKIIAFQYDWQGNLTKTIYPSGLVVDRTYNEQNQLEQIKTPVSQ